MLHDIGRLILSDKVPDQLIEVDQLEISKRIDTIQAETEVIGYDHTMVSKGLMQQWGLPEVLCECVKNHHEVEHTGEYADAGRIIYLANRLSQNVPPMDEDEAIEQLSSIPGWQASKISSEAIFDACHQSEDLVFEVMESLGMVDIENNIRVNNRDILLTLAYPFQIARFRRVPGPGKLRERVQTIPVGKKLP